MKKNLSYYLALPFLALVFYSCTQDGIDGEIYGSGQTLNPSGKKEAVVFNINNFTGSYYRTNLQEAKIKLVEYFCFSTPDNGKTPTLYSHKTFDITNETNLSIKDSLPAGKYKINILASTENFKPREAFDDWDGKTTPSFLFEPGYKGGLVQNGILPGYENTAWTYRYDNDVFSKIIDLEVRADQSNGVEESVNLSRLVGKVKVTVNNLYAKSLPDSVNYVVLATGTPGNDIGKVFSLLDNKLKPYNFEWYNDYFTFGRSTFITKQQIINLNEKGISSYTFEMNLIEGAGENLSLLGRYNYGVYPTDKNNFFTLKVNTQGLKVVKNKILQFKGNLDIDKNDDNSESQVSIGDIDTQWGEEINGEDF